MLEHWQSLAILYAIGWFATYAAQMIDNGIRMGYGFSREPTWNRNSQLRFATIWPVLLVCLLIEHGASLYATAYWSDPSFGPRVRRNARHLRERARRQRGGRKTPRPRA